MKKNQYVGKKIKIVACKQSGKDYSNLIRDSQHVVVKIPKDKDGKLLHDGSDNSVWVMGAEKPVRIMEGEFMLVPNQK